MLDAAVQAIDDGRPEAARGIMASRARAPPGDDPVAARPLLQHRAGRAARPGLRRRRVDELANQLGIEHEVQIEVDVERGRAARREGAGRALPDRPRVAEPGRAARAALEDLGRRSARRTAARSRRSSPTTARASGARRRSTAIGERASTLNGRFSVEQGADGGTAIHVVLPAYAGSPSSTRSRRWTTATRTAGHLSSGPSTNGRSRRATATCRVGSTSRRRDAAAVSKIGRRRSRRPPPLRVPSAGRTTHACRTNKIGPCARLPGRPPRPVRVHCSSA